MITTSEIRAIARVLWDDIYQNERGPTEQDHAFLDALARADSKWSDTVRLAKRSYHDHPKVLQAMRNLAARQQAAEYLAAYKTFTAAEEIEFAQAAE
jgi:hypothetical protein